MLEMYVRWVPTKKASKIIETLCGKTYSKSFVSSLSKELDQEVKQWRNSDLSTIKYPYLLVDVIYIKVRENRRVVSKLRHIAIGINEKGNREIIGFDICDREIESSWTNFFEDLKTRGQSGLKMVISDFHKSLLKSRKIKDKIFVRYESEKKFQDFLNTLIEGFEDAFAYLSNDVIHSKYRSSNCLEKLNDEVIRQ